MKRGEGVFSLRGRRGFEASGRLLEEQLLEGEFPLVWRAR